VEGGGEGEEPKVDARKDQRRYKCSGIKPKNSKENSKEHLTFQAEPLTFWERFNEQ